MRRIISFLLIFLVGAAFAAESGARAEYFYRSAENCFYGRNGFPRDIAKAVKLYTMAAKAGHSWAQLALARILCSNIAGERDYVQAFDWAKKSAEKVPAANMLLAWFYISGEGGIYDPAAGFKCYQKAAYHRLPDGYGGLAWCYILGKGTAINIPLALENLQKGAERGDIISQWMLASCHFYGQFMPVDRKAAEHWFRKFRDTAWRYAEAGAPGCYYQLGMMYRFGLLESYDMKQCLELWKLAVDGGYADAAFAYAQELLAGVESVRDVPEAVRVLKSIAGKELKAKLLLVNLYDIGIHVKRDRAYAERLFKELMAQWDDNKAEAAELLELGLHIESGIGCPPDPEKAKHYYRKAMEKLRPQADNGVLFSQMQLGISSYFGLGTGRDHAAAEKYLRSARTLIKNHAECDAITAVTLYGIMHLHGWGVPGSPETAVKLLKRSAGSGSGAAAYVLYEIYRDGNGVTASPVEAEKFLKFAADRKFLPAIKEKSR
ncbi:MAG: sel1 repeat family protein [Lentisphaeria bacterium]|nr:sel1 repeat family protein [Lentisphaeria bacterium]